MCTITGDVFSWKYQFHADKAKGSVYVDTNKQKKRHRETIQVAPTTLITWRHRCRGWRKKEKNTNSQEIIIDLLSETLQPQTKINIQSNIRIASQLNLHSILFEFYEFMKK